jgi:hypothetical protein
MNKKVVTLALLIGMGSLAQAGTFVATENEKYGTDELHKIAFNGDEVKAYFTDGTEKTYDFSSLQRIYFTDPTEVETIGKEAELYIYPNPVNDEVHLTGVPDDAQLSIINLNGTTIMTPQKASNGTAQINVSSLNKGIYFLRVNQKMVKFIKQ